ncbi:hypothetical protein NEFER03_2101 [Nematocida sp. LUAm3]|nr:hypothetical protein NEFER03_2101 [Nematocida sp. LUAm3]KAI5175647.1 hypothetical protein NEFER02_1534 [Nematocida sp. LUAm2]KAI5178553.1 hypothetical protein NEFER01_1689 [Nematocida sp. LUAm1]
MEKGEEVLSVPENEIEPFTQRTFHDICQESFLRRVPHVIGKVETKEKEGYTLYDARHLCKYLFELVISKDGRSIRMKNRTNPMDDLPVKEILFYEVSPEKTNVGEYIGSQKDFLESSKFRSKIFNRNDPFDALSINFIFKEAATQRVSKKTLIPLLTSIAVLLIIILGCTMNLLSNTKLKKPLL